MKTPYGVFNFLVLWMTLLLFKGFYVYEKQNHHEELVFELLRAVMVIERRKRERATTNATNTML